MFSPYGGVCCVGYVWFVGGDGGGNSVDACWRASLIVLGICLYVDWNSFGVSMALVSGFWICVSAVMPYMYSLSRYFWVLDLERFVRLL